MMDPLLPFDSIDSIKFELVIIILISGLAAYRLSGLIIEDEVTRPFREWIWKYFPPEKSFFGYLFTCYRCLSVWFAIAILASFILFPVVTLVISAILAISGIVVIIDSALKR